ncbi:nuclear transport factor 2 family protein [Halobacterium litoreum]|uniref:Nuclear transport factor 2 family protein n=1 Tax=Halobacterium litoreum TaxID=2039234 RepID=A0ABD5NGW1_9EURY|nr:nuclear transport factor 2 family protein [Halobacterium litoreum]UHH12676.1 nuclear transport factor 2 family protein [Halobacterium litoreum]
MSLRERVHAYYDAVDDGRVDDLLALFADDVVYERPGQSPIEGKAELAEFYREDRPLTDGTHEIETVAVDGDRAAVRGTFEGKQDGDPVTFGFADFHTFEDGDIAERHTFTDRDAV